jgi:hypothetical protein
MAQGASRRPHVLANAVECDPRIFHDGYSTMSGQPRAAVPLQCARMNESNMPVIPLALRPE